MNLGGCWQFRNYDLESTYICGGHLPWVPQHWECQSLLGPFVTTTPPPGFIRILFPFSFSNMKIDHKNNALKRGTTFFGLTQSGKKTLPSYFDDQKADDSPKNWFSSIQRFQVILSTKTMGKVARMACKGKYPKEVNFSGGFPSIPVSPLPLNIGKSTSWKAHGCFCFFVHNSRLIQMKEPLEDKLSLFFAKTFMFIAPDNSWSLALFLQVQFFFLVFLFFLLEDTQTFTNQLTSSN